MEKTSAPPFRSSWPDVPGPAVGCAVIAAAALIAYLPTFRNGFVWDDAPFLTENVLIRSPDGIRRLWLTKEAADYWPVTYSELWCEWRLWGNQAVAYHVGNLILHALETAFLWRVLRRLEIPGAFFAALLFAVHPVNVESVAWIAQRKNLLAMLFFLTSIYGFLRTLAWSPATNGASASQRPREPLRRKGESSIENGPRLRWYCISVGAFAVAMLCKGSVAPLPIVLAGIIAFRRRLNLKDVALLAPFMGIAVALGAVNLWFQSHGAGHIRPVGSLERVLGAGGAVWFYLGKALLPLHLTFIYPQWHPQPDNPIWWIPLLAAVAFTVALWRFSRPAFAGWAYFCVMLVPALGFADVGFMQYSLVADHYEHLAIIGVLAFVAWAWANRAAAPRMRARVPEIAAVPVIALLSVWTFRQAELYRNDASLFAATIRDNPGSWIAQDGLGVALLDSGHAAEACLHFAEAAKLKPEDAGVAYNVGLALRATGANGEALEWLERSSRLNPERSETWATLAVCLSELGKVKEGLACAERAVQLNPGDADASNDLGTLQLELEQIPEALASFDRAVSLRTDFPEAQANLGYALLKSGRLADAIAAFHRILDRHPDFADAHLKLALALGLSGRQDEAISEHETGLRLKRKIAPANP